MIVRPGTVLGVADPSACAECIAEPQWSRGMSVKWFNSGAGELVESGDVTLSPQSGTCLTQGCS